MDYIKRLQLRLMSEILISLLGSLRKDRVSLEELIEKFDSYFGDKVNATVNLYKFTYTRSNNYSTFTIKSNIDNSGANIIVKKISLKKVEFEIFYGDTSESSSFDRDAVADVCNKGGNEKVDAVMQLFVEAALFAKMTIDDMVSKELEKEK